MFPLCFLLNVGNVRPCHQRVDVSGTTLTEAALQWTKTVHSRGCGLGSKGTFMASTPILEKNTFWIAQSVFVQQFSRVVLKKMVPIGIATRTIICVLLTSHLQQVPYNDDDDDDDDVLTTIIIINIINNNINISSIRISIIIIIHHASCIIQHASCILHHASCIMHASSSPSSSSSSPHNHYNHHHHIIIIIIMIIISIIL